ncbi:MAG: alkaline phosphatase family protein [Gemmataceae bacterium]
MARRTCVIILLDGLGDRSYPTLKGQTPLQAAHTPNLDRLAESSACGLFHATQLGQPLPSEDAHFALFGYSPAEFPGRGPLEALGAGIQLAHDDVAILAHLASIRTTPEGLVLVQGELKSNPQEADSLFAALDKQTFGSLHFRLVRTHRLFGILVVSGGASPFITDIDPLVKGRLLIEPQPWRSHVNDADTKRTIESLKEFVQFTRAALVDHPVNRVRGQRNEPSADLVVTQRAGRLKKVVRFQERFGLRGLMLASGIILPGLATYLGMDVHKVTDSDRPDDDLAERITLAQSFLKEYDLIHVHTKIPDVAAHTKDPLNKVSAIEACDRGIGAAIGPLLNDPDVVVMVTADHSTPSSGSMIHSGEPVPLLIHGPGVRHDRVDRFDEVAVAGGALSLVRGRELISLILNYLDRAKLHGLMDTPDDQPYWPGDYQPLILDES